MIEARSEAQVAGVGRRGTVMVADGDRRFRGALAAFLSRHGFEVICVADGSGLLRQLAIRGPSGGRMVDAVISEVSLPKVGGLHVLRGLAGTRWAAPFILTSHAVDRDTRTEAQSAGAHAIFEKPLVFADLLHAVRALEHHVVRPLPS